MPKHPFDYKDTYINIRRMLAFYQGFYVNVVYEAPQGFKVATFNRDDEIIAVDHFNPNATVHGCL